ncbi:sulfurtransferase TusA family protein [Venenivibrio stagnispumantis]|uniref:TusA-related sulfurtransferase n=1 Tax=Venenivibrio stagnispumantis TaxID=407998 RepID=A0AA46AF19_9AQUI|nr:sulfurtransferase TusA family protein [Venenivibrio stagnispumantis]MCW4573584.1 sulfurtransferase TusA family protein [Venenivibrio stagnispumantis]SMP16732.1 TusA-related sulfurtransferase [Venenivibrio stagnispumantis]
MEITRELDLKGEVCPFTFVKSKLILEQMNKGEILKIILDYKPSVDNVPKSMKEEGQEVIAVNQLDNNLWEVIVRKVK